MSRLGRGMRVGALLDVVCERTGVSREEMRSKSRERHVSTTRGLFFFFARRHLPLLGWRTITRFSTGGDPSGARRQYEAFLRRVAKDPQLADEVRDLEREMATKGMGL